MGRVLITGGAGFIGTNFVYHWLEHHPGDRVVVLDALTYAGNLDNLASAQANLDFSFVQGDIQDQALVEDLIRDHDLDTLVHFAAESHVDRSITGPDAFIQTNVLGTHALLKAAKNCWLDSGIGRPHRFHHVSTDEVFGSLGPEDPPFTEKSPHAPNSPYAASKAASDHLVRAYHKTYGLDVSISNCSNNYGPFQFPEKLIPLCISQILKDQPLPIYGDGKQIRDWLFVADHNRAIDLILSQGAPGAVYAIGGNNELTNLDLVTRLCRKMDEKFEQDSDLARRFPTAPPARGHESSELITRVADRPGHDRRYAMDASRIEGDLGFKPREDFDSGLDRTLDWYLSAPDGYRG